MASDLTGRRFGNLVVQRRCEERAKNGEVQWECDCDCGASVVVRGYNLRASRTTSCGCARLSHGLSKHPLYHTWKSMIRRCHDPAHPRYSEYGGRGIQVCLRWRDAIEAFIADVGQRPPGHTLDRVDNDKGYFPDNVRWATASEQNTNKRRPMNAQARAHLREEVEAARAILERITIMLDESEGVGE